MLAYTYHGGVPKVKFNACVHHSGVPKVECSACVHHRGVPKVDRVSVPLPIAIDILMVRNGEGQSSHVLVLCVNLELSGIISFTLKSPSYVHIAVSSLQYICC